MLIPKGSALCHMTALKEADTSRQVGTSKIAQLFAPACLLGPESWNEFVLERKLKQQSLDP